ncbi:asparaginase [Paenibacillus baekrokdamisoli]|uniref:Asparaginase n=1 Tax=Paenibacillus baekrokdamisoli TaxID=1712516 RepID=A0A3G9IY29_9BACL|nr:asparaginase [Paenibacillus baekrokdamisoli]MBB3068995.1 L-asparaginase II [Paenibacillus baekrokdamisoli]BBH23817.1 asparaginase [Paenibacillus baekrokdamisoli]
MKLSALVEQYRGSVLENVHMGVLCGVNEFGEVLYEVGNAEHRAFLRSAAKPFQAIPVMQDKVVEAFGITGEEAALFAASQRGEAYQLRALESILRKTGISEEQLITRPTIPLNDEPKLDYLMKGLPPRCICHNCSGKHLGILSLCKVMGYPMDNYGDINHPAQQRILKVLSELSECPVSDIHIAIDGCGFPVFALPLKCSASAYLKLACPDLIADESVRNAVIQITGYMNAYPNMIASHDFICSELLRDSNIVAKGGAKGFYAFALKKERIAFALKVIDGSENPWPIIVASVLEQMRYSNKETIRRMYELTPKEIRNDNGVIVGENKAAFRF